MTAKTGELGVANPKGNVHSDEARVCFGSGWKSCPPPDLASIMAECLSAAEAAAEQVLNCVHPTLDSEEKRRDVIDYVQELVQNRLNCEMVSYGSVPLKTYLPDGDIDLTVLKGPNAVESLANAVVVLLQNEERNENAEYQVKETQFIDAEVKLVKCFVGNFVIDISFNQLGGLSALCFLEQVNRFVGRDHLFKHSIILIKTWCYYESRILGAHHGLLSTYALEILVLYIFHHFHSSLTGPLSALYRFLDYYSQFDWENYCISLRGPVCKISLPDIVVMMPEGGMNHPLLSEEFLEYCLELFSVPSRGLEPNPPAFHPKHLNIIDPLKENNNLGRSVHRGNFYRICSAFKFGAHKLGQVLLRPTHEVADEICKFFTNARSRHECQYADNIRHLAFNFGDEKSFTESLSSQVELFSEDDDMLLKSSASDCDDVSVNIGHMPNLDARNEEVHKYLVGEVSLSSEKASDASYSADGVFVCGGLPLGAKHGLATATSNSSSNYNGCLSDNHLHNPHSKSSTENGSLEALQSDLPSTDSDKFGSISWPDNRDQLLEMKPTYRWCVDSSDAACLKGSVLEDTYFDFRETDSASNGGEWEAFNPLADLSGDYDGNIRSLLRAQLCHRSSLTSSGSSHRPFSPPRIQNRKPWDVVRQSMPLKMNSNINNSNNFSQMNSQIVSTDYSMYSGPNSRLSTNAFYFDGKQKPRGTGTYFPHTSVVCMERSSYGRGKNKASGNKNHFHWYGHSNGIYPGGEMKSFESGYEVPSRKRCYRRNRRSDVRTQTNYPVGGGNQDNGCFSALCRIEFGSIGNLCKKVIPCSAHVGGTMDATLKTRGSSAVLIGQRVAGQSIHLKNEDEFPPLCQ